MGNRKRLQSSALAIIILIVFATGCTSMHTVQSAKKNYPTLKQPPAEINSSISNESQTPPLLKKRIRDLISNINERKVSHSLYGSIPFYPSVIELAKIGKPAVPFLIEALGDTRFSSSYAAMALGEIGPDAAEAVPFLIGLLDYKPHQFDTVEALGGIGPAAKPAVPRLIQILHNSRSGRDSLDQITAKALSNIGDQSAVPVLIEALETDSDEFLQVSAAEALSKLGDASVTPKLVLAYTSRSRSVRLAVIQALSELQDLGALNTLTDALDDDYDIVQSYALMGIVDLAKKVQEAELLQGLESALDGKPAYIRQRVVDAFEGAPYSSAVTQLLTDPQAKKLREAKYHYELESMGAIRHASIDLDAKNNAYIFGPVLRKLDDSGVEQWSLSIPDLDRVTATMIDESGCVFLAGVRRDSRAFAAAKVDETGRLIWIAEAPKVASRFGEPKAIALTYDGQVLLAGSYYGKEVTDVRIVKVGFTSNGRLTQVSIGDKADIGGRYGVAGRNVSTTQLMAIDDMGRVYSFFRKFFARSEPEMVLVRFDTQGRLEWVAPCEGFHNLGPSDIKIDAKGNTYLAGKNTNAKGRLIKVNANGNVKWSRDLDGSEIRGMALSTIGDIVVGWNRWPSKLAAQVAVLSSEGVVKSIEDVSYGTGPGGTGFLVDFATGAPGFVSIVIQWQQTRIQNGTLNFGSSGSRLVTYEINTNNGIQPTRVK